MKNIHPREEDDLVDSSTAIALKRAAMDESHKTLADALSGFESAVQNVRKQLSTYTEAHRELADTLKETESAMKSTHADWELSIAVCESLISKPTDEVRFNACGTEFVLSANTLRKYPGSFFGTYVCGRWEVKAAPLFLECDARIFAHIVRYMLYGTLDVSAMEAEERKLLKEEAEKYVLTGLFELVKESQQHSSPPPLRPWSIVHSAQGVVKDNGRRLCFPLGFHSYASVCANGSIGWTSGMHVWAVHRNIGADNLIGVSCGSISGSSRAENESHMNVVNLTTRCVRNISGNLGASVFHRREAETFHVQLDLDKHTVTFGVDYIWNSSPTFKNLSHGPWFPYFDICHEGGSMTLLSQ